MNLGQVGPQFVELPLRYKLGDTSPPGIAL